MNSGSLFLVSRFEKHTSEVLCPPINYFSKVDFLQIQDRLKEDFTWILYYLCVLNYNFSLIWWHIATVCILIFYAVNGVPPGFETQVHRTPCCMVVIIYCSLKQCFLSIKNNGT